MNKKRASVVDLWRFIALIMIMIHHLYIFGDPFTGEYCGRFGWIFVEFFFIVAGYFTYKHFRNTNSIILSNPA